MNLPNDINKAIRKAKRGSLHQQTFVFLPSEMISDGNDTLNAFLETHNALSVLFSECKGKLVYVIIYKE